MPFRPTRWLCLQYSASFNKQSIFLNTIIYDELFFINANMADMLPCDEGEKTTSWNNYKSTSKEDILRSLIDRDKYEEETQRLIGNEVIADSLREKWMKNEEELEALKKAKQEEFERSLKNPTFEQKVLFYSCTVILWIGIIAFVFFFYHKVLPLL
ncbi:MAG TPA: hypothetical protein DCP79_02235 [Prevotella sp.]|nr:hypothetical protein [Prevotella sp.]